MRENDVAYWRLTPAQREHYLGRLYEYHAREATRRGALRTRYARIAAALCIAAAWSMMLTAIVRIAR